MKRACGVYMDHEVFNTFSKYASMRRNRRAYEVWAEALTTFMKNNPIDGVHLEVYEKIERDLPRRKEILQMKLLSEQIRAFSNKLRTMSGQDNGGVRERLIQLLTKGMEIKNPTQEFLDLMEEAVDLI